MWDAEKEFEILGEVEQYDLEDEITDEFPYPEFEPSADEDDDFEYEGDLDYDEEDD